MKKRYLKLDEVVNGLPEATIASNRPDTGGVCGDDDRPPGNITFGQRYQRRKYYNKLTPYQTIWDVDDLEKFTWDFFENLGGMEDVKNYSNTLQGLEKVIPKETWENMWKKMKKVSAAKAKKGFIAAGQPHRDGEDRTGIDSEEYADLDWNAKNTEIEDDNVDGLVEKIKNIIL